MLRFLAAMSIVIYHAYGGNLDKPGFMVQADGSLSASGKVINTVIGNFWIGVDLFFLISGFLITYLLLEEKEIYSKINIKQFYLRRVLRIWPLYYLVLSTGPLMTYFYQEGVPEYSRYLVFLGNFELIKTGWISPSVAHLWSICVEEHFYLLWPLVVAFIPLKRLPAFFMTVIIGSLLFKAYLYYDANNAWMKIFLHTLSRCDTLVIGALLAYYYFKKPFEMKVPLAVRLLVYAFGIFMLCTDDFAEWNSLFDALFKKLFYAGILGFWMLNYMFNPDAKFVIKNRVINYFGKVSYGIYMFHPMIVVVVLHRLRALGYPEFWLLALTASVVTILLATLSYETFEKPFLKLKNKFSPLMKSEIPNPK